MKYPLIGITTSIDMQEGTYCSKSSYAACISQAGGIPVLLPADECIGREGNYVKRLDGILFAGGGDIHPHFWGEEPLDGFEMGNILPQRDSFEIRLCQIAEERRLPLLGICRGIQIMAVASGGSIHQDIDTGLIKRTPRVRHMQKAPDWCETHKVQFVSDTRLAEIYHAQEILVNSFHHQSVKKVPESYRVSAKSTDGVIEGIESTILPFSVGVQWHPERTAQKDQKTMVLFKTFVRYAAQYREEKIE